MEVTLNSPIAVGHSNFLESMLILIMRVDVVHINFQPTLNFKQKPSMSHISFFFFSMKINMGDCFVLRFICPITNIQCVGQKSS